MNGHVRPRLVAGGLAGRRPGGQSWRRATAILEMALVLPLLLTLILGAMDFGQYFYLQSAFESAARDAARVGGSTTAATGDPASAATAALAAVHVTFNPSWMTITDIYTPTTDVTTVAAGHFLTVIIQVPVEQVPGIYRPLFQMTGMGFGNGKLLYGRCTVVKD